MNPIRSSLPSSSWLVATVVPWLTAEIVSPAVSSEMPSRASTLRTPVRKPSAGSAGVDGVFVVVVWPVSSSTATTSVNVPPVSMPMRIRRAVMAGTLAVRYPGGKGHHAGGSGLRAVVGGAGPVAQAADLRRVEAVVSRSRCLFLGVDPARVLLPGGLLAHAESPGDGGPGGAGRPSGPDGELLAVARLAGDHLAEGEELEDLVGRQPLAVGHFR